MAPHRRPHYQPTERMAILQLMAARGWSKAEAGRRFLVTDDTIASWSGRIEEDEPGALVKMPQWHLNADDASGLRVTFHSEGIIAAT